VASTQPNQALISFDGSIDDKPAAP